jgi:hypothetical protein
MNPTTAMMAAPSGYECSILFPTRRQHNSLILLDLNLARRREDQQRLSEFKGLHRIKI